MAIDFDKNGRPHDTRHRIVYSSNSLPCAPSAEGWNVRRFIDQRLGIVQPQTEWPATISIRALPSDGLVIAYIQSRSLCGSGGCHLLILQKRGGTYEMLGSMMRVHLPVRLLSGRSSGRPIFGVWVAGGGITNGYERAVAFDGRRYPRWPEVGQSWPAQANVDGTILIPRGDVGCVL